MSLRLADMHFGAEKLQRCQKRLVALLLLFVDIWYVFVVTVRRLTSGVFSGLESSEVVMVVLVVVVVFSVRALDTAAADLPADFLFTVFSSFFSTCLPLFLNLWMASSAPCKLRAFSHESSSSP